MRQGYTITTSINSNKKNRTSAILDLDPLPRRHRRRRVGIRSSSPSLPPPSFRRCGKKRRRRRKRLWDPSFSHCTAASGIWDQNLLQCYASFRRRKTLQECPAYAASYARFVEVWQQLKFPGKKHKSKIESSVLYTTYEVPFLFAFQKRLHFKLKGLSAAALARFKCTICESDKEEIKRPRKTISVLPPLPKKEIGRKKTLYNTGCGVLF